MASTDAPRPLQLVRDYATFLRWVRIVVEDEGPGLARAAKVGRRFVRGPGSAKAPGFGVGVWLTRVIAEANGGKLRLSRRPGGGTRAVVTLPRSGPAGA